MWSTQPFNEQVTGYYGNSLDYQSNLINGSNSNIYTNANSIIKQSSPLLAHSPISDDESPARKKQKYNNSKGQRNTRKVIIEKKRRDRINLSLDELRKLVPAANEKQGSAKLEKAEILQMTVDHLKGLHSKGFDAFSFDPHTFATKYHINGFRECAEQVTQYLKSAEGFGFNEPLKLRLLDHIQRYIKQREYDLKTNSANGLSWNPNLFILPSSANQPTLSTTNSSLVNTTPSTNAQQLLSSSNSSPITTLTSSSSLSNHSNSSTTSSSSNYQQQQINQQQQNDSTSPLCESPVLNNSLNASQLLNHSSYTDSNNNSHTSSSSNNSIHSESNAHSAAIQSLNSSNNDERCNLLSNNLLSNSLGSMGPPPPPLQKVAVFNGVLQSHPPNTSELTYTSMSNMHPAATNSPYTHPSFIKMESNSIATNGYASAAYANHIHHTQSYFNNALTYGTVGHQKIVGGASVVLQPTHTSPTVTSQQYPISYKRPWNSEIGVNY